MTAIQQKNKEACDAFYTPRLAQFDGVKALGWGSMGGQAIRHRRIFEYIEADSSILDVGCGDGYSAQFCKDGYLGIDIIPAMVDRAKVANPEYNFQVCSIDDVKDTFDWVIGIGIFGFPFDCFLDYFFHTSKKMFALCGTGVAFNIPNVLFDTSRIVKIIKTVSPLYSIRTYPTETCVHFFRR